MVEFGLKSFGSVLAQKLVVWKTDNQAVTSIVCKGSMKPELNHMALAIFEHCAHMQIDLRVQWISRAFNTEADALSRLSDTDDWQIKPEIFAEINTMWGPFTIDRFANWRNTQLPRFNARYWSPGVEAVDAFTQDWSGVHENNWIVPPPCLALRVIQHLKTCRAKGTLVVPHWPSYPFWPVLFPDKKADSFIRQTRLIENGAACIIAGEQPKSVFTPDKLKSGLLFVRFDASGVRGSF